MNLVASLTRIWDFLKKPFVSFVLRVVVSGLLLAYLFHLSAFDQIAQAFSRIKLPFLLVYFLLFFMSFSLLALRWKYFLKAWDIQLGFGTLFRWIMTGMFLNNFLPGSLGGDAYRLFCGTRRTGKVDVIAATIFYERILGYSALVIMGLIALVIRADFGRDWLFWLMLWGVFLALLGIVLISFVPFVYRLANRFIERHPLAQKLRLDNWLDSFRFKVTHPGTLLTVFAISFMIQILDVLSFRLVASALQIPVHISDLLLFIPLLYLAILIPLSVNGIGIRESVFVIFSSLWGISSADAVAFSLTVFTLNLAGSLVGGPLYWMDRIRPGDSTIKQDIPVQDERA
jgi:uncharacterized protein (TIRG00374 family)